MRKRKRVDDKENRLPELSDHTASLMSTSKKPKYSARRNNQQKLEDVLKAIDNANWVLGNLFLAASISICNLVGCNNLFTYFEDLTVSGQLGNYITPTLAPVRFIVRCTRRLKQPHGAKLCRLERIKENAKRPRKNTDDLGRLPSENDTVPGGSSYPRQAGERPGSGSSLAFQALYYANDAAKQAFASLPHRMDPVTFGYFAAFNPHFAKIVQEHDQKMRERLDHNITNWAEGVQPETFEGDASSRRERVLQYYTLPQSRSRLSQDLRSLMEDRVAGAMYSSLRRSTVAMLLPF
ncbi:hypothetical protein JOM56_010111 [Amanita muscaria]